MADTRRKNVNWTIDVGAHGHPAASLAVLMDIRDELQTLNRLLVADEAEVKMAASVAR